MNKKEEEGKFKTSNSVFLVFPYVAISIHIIVCITTVEGIQPAKPVLYKYLIFTEQVRSGRSRLVASNDGPGSVDLNGTGQIRSAMGESKTNDRPGTVDNDISGWILKGVY